MIFCRGIGDLIPTNWRDSAESFGTDGTFHVRVESMDSKNSEWIVHTHVYTETKIIIRKFQIY